MLMKFWPETKTRASLFLGFFAVSVQTWKSDIVGSGRCVRVQASSINIQAPEKLQYPSSNRCRINQCERRETALSRATTGAGEVGLGCCCLDVLWSLGLGCGSFCQQGFHQKTTHSSVGIEQRHAARWCGEEIRDWRGRPAGRPPRGSAFPTNPENSHGPPHPSAGHGRN